MNFINQKLKPLILGLLTASLTMTIFEYINSKIYPFPEALDLTNREEFMAYVNTLPLNAYILVFSGYVIGSLFGGIIVTKFSHDKSINHSLVLGIILAVFSVFNSIIVGHNLNMLIASALIMLVFSLLGYEVVHRHMFGIDKKAK